MWGAVEMGPGESPCCGTGSTGEPSGVAQVGERDEADLEELTPVFFCLGYAKCIHLVSQETPLLPSWLGALA